MGLNTYFLSRIEFLNIFNKYRNDYNELKSGFDELVDSYNQLMDERNELEKTVEKITRKNYELTEQNKQKAQVLTLHHKEWLGYKVLILDIIGISIGEQGHCYVV